MKLQTIEEYLFQTRDITLDSSIDYSLKLYQDYDCSMAWVKLNDKPIYYGNFWDYHNGCFGEYKVREYHGASDYCAMIESMLRRAGYKVRFERLRGDWNEEH